MMNWHNYSGGWGSGTFGMHLVMHLIWYAVLIGIVALLVSYLLKRSGAASGRPGALDVLKERYAKGELTKDDFDRMRKEIA